MRASRRRLAPTLLAGALVLAPQALVPQPPPPAQPELDARTRLVKSRDWELVREECTSCHSTKIVVQTRADRDGWLGMLRWMQETQELRRFSPDEETRILDYLVREYGPVARNGRRPRLAEHLLPPPAP